MQGDKYVIISYVFKLWGGLFLGSQAYVCSWFD